MRSHTWHRLLRDLPGDEDGEADSGEDDRRDIGGEGRQVGGTPGGRVVKPHGVTLRGRDIGGDAEGEGRQAARGDAGEKGCEAARGDVGRDAGGDGRRGRGKVGRGQSEK